MEIREEDRDGRREGGIHFAEILAHMLWETYTRMFAEELLIIS